MIYELRGYKSEKDWNEEYDEGVIVWEMDEIKSASEFKFGGRLVAYLGVNSDELVIPEGIESIGYSAFVKGEWECFDPAVDKVILPSTLKKIEEGAFIDTMISDIEFHKDSQCALIEDGGLYTKDKKTLLWIMNGNEDDEFFVADGTERLGLGCFGNFWDLTLVVPESVKEIGYGEDVAFAYESVTIRAPKNSFAHNFAVENGIDYEEL